MSNEGLLFKAVRRASIPAGPLFLALLGMLEFQADLPEPLVIADAGFVEFLAVMLIIIPVTVIVGTCLAFPVCLIMGGMLLLLANRFPLARPTALWIAIGAGAAIAINHELFGAVAESGALAFAGTAAACGALVRSCFHWD
jgi:hypothetical protein